MADRSSEKPKRHRSHAITKLYGWSRFPDSIDASLLYATEVSLLIPPDVENMRGVNDPSSTSVPKRRTIVIQKEPVRWSFVRPNGTKRTSCLVFNSLSIAVAAILPLRVR